MSGGLVLFLIYMRDFSQFSSSSLSFLHLERFMQITNVCFHLVFFPCICRLLMLFFRDPPTLRFFMSFRYW